MPDTVQEAVCGHERHGIADGADDDPACQRLAHERHDPLRRLRLPLHTPDEDQPCARFGQRRGVAVGRGLQPADRPDGPAVGGHVFHAVGCRASRHRARPQRRGEECRLPVCEIVEQDEYDLLFHISIYR